MAKAKTVANTADDPTVNYVTVELSGKKYKLAYDFSSLAIAEQLSGQNLLEAISLNGITMLQLQGLFFGCLIKAQPKITLAEVGLLMNHLPNLPKIKQAIADTWIASMPAPDPNEQAGEDENDLAPASE
jgi:hypothetical protein